MVALLGVVPGKRGDSGRTGSGLSSGRGGDERLSSSGSPAGRTGSASKWCERGGLGGGSESSSAGSGEGGSGPGPGGHDPVEVGHLVAGAPERVGTTGRDGVLDEAVVAHAGELVSSEACLDGGCETGGAAGGLDFADGTKERLDATGTQGSGDNGDEFEGGETDASLRVGEEWSDGDGDGADIDGVGRVLEEERRHHVDCLLPDATVAVLQSGGESGEDGFGGELGGEIEDDHHVELLEDGLLVPQMLAQRPHHLRQMRLQP